MASGTTDKGKYLMLKYSFDGETVPTTYRLILCTDATSPTKATDSLSSLTELAAGNGYTAGGKAITASEMTVTEVDGSVGAKVVLDDQQWDATGAFPSSGDGARWAVLTDGTAGSSNVLAYFDLTSDRTLVNGQFLKLTGIEIDLNEPS
jgi:hypothetical protein